MEALPAADSPNDPLQFDRVEPSNAEAPAVAACAGCQQPVLGTYYEVGGRMICERCREGVVTAFTGGSRIARLAKALLFGTIAALISAAVWIAIIKFTGYELALVAIVVGILVGTAVRKGANSRGGWVYQSMAVVLTYLAITGSYVPLVISAIGEQAIESNRLLVAGDAARTPISIDRDGAVSMNGASATVEEAIQEIQRLKSANGFILYHREGRDEMDPPASADQLAEEWSRLDVHVVPSRDPLGQDLELDRVSFSKAPLLGKVLLIGIGFFYAVQSPFLQGASGLISVLIIGIGLLQAWKINKRPILNITGPHRLAPPIAVARRENASPALLDAPDTAS